MTTGQDKVLVVDDEVSVLSLFETLLTKEGYTVTCVSSGKDALLYLETEWFDLLLSDLRMPDIDGLALLERAKALNPALPVIVLTGHGTVDTAVTAMKEGAYDYLTKPVDNNDLKLVVRKALDLYHLTYDLHRLRKQMARSDDFSNIIGRSRPMRTLLRQVMLVSASQSTILIQGESGTGKELIARAIHQHSTRRKAPFVAIDCGTLPEPLLESELFGHTKGAFTGAIQNKKGLFEEAHGGTLFLDEIGDTALIFQSKLLRVLQEGEVRPVGSNRQVRADVRVIAATNKDLRKQVEHGLFRSDLYYRLAVVPLHLPPLRQRSEDVPLLVEHFTKKYCERNDLDAKTVAPKALQLLMAAPWPGNVRELENVIERAVLLSPGFEIGAEVLFPYQVEDMSLSTPLAQTSKTAVETVEREKIREGLRKANGVRLHAARLLGISRATLYSKIKRYQLDHEIQT